MTRLSPSGAGPARREILASSSRHQSYLKVLGLVTEKGNGMVSSVSGCNSGLKQLLFPQQLKKLRDAAFPKPRDWLECRGRDLNPHVLAHGGF